MEQHKEKVVGVRGTTTAEMRDKIDGDLDK